MGSVGDGLIAEGDAVGIGGLDPQWKIVFLIAGASIRENEGWSENLDQNIERDIYGGEGDQEQIHE